MMKKVFLMLTVAVLLCGLCLTSSAVSVEEEAEQLYEDLPSDAAELLGQLGIDGAVSDKVFELSFRSVISCVASVARSGVKKPLMMTAKLLTVLLLVSMIRVLAAGSTELTGMFCTLLCAVVTVGETAECINALMSCARICSDFLLAYIPVFSVIICLSGSAATALTYHTTVLAFCELLSQAAGRIIAPLCGILMSLGISLSANEALNSGKLIGAVNKAISWATAAALSLFASVLSLKGIMTSSADSLTAGGIKLIFSSFIPIVGTAIGNAYSSIAGSLSLIKGSVAVFGIGAVFALTLPVLTDSFLYGLAFSFLSYAADVTSQKGMASVFGCMRCVLRLMSAVLSVQIFMTVISTGLMILMKGSA